MEKSLKIVQTFAKIAQIICKVLFILLVVVGSICLACIPLMVFSNSGDLSVFFMEFNGVSLNLKGGIFILVIVSIVMAAAAVIAKFYEIYFKNVVRAGTPFTHAGAKEMMRVGIIDLAVSLGVSLFVSLAFEIAMNGALGSAEAEISITSSAGFAFILISFLLRYGADVLAAKASDAKEESEICDNNAPYDLSGESSISETQTSFDRPSL